jgi:hypothetical protein
MRRLLFAAAVALAAWLVPVVPALAACGDGGPSGVCFWIGGGANANWNTTGNWSNTSGGGTSGTVPVAGDAIVMDSGSAASTFNGALSIRSFDSQGYTGTLTHSAAVAMTVTGDDATSATGVYYRLGSGMTLTLSNATTSSTAFASTSGSTATITGNNSGATRRLGNTTINTASGAYSLGSDFGVGPTATFTLANFATFTAANFNVSAGLYDLSATNTRTVTCGTGTWTATGTTGVVWNRSTSSNLTLTCNTGTIDLAATATGTRTLTMGLAQTYNNFSVTNPTANGYAISIGTSSVTTTIANLTLTNVQFVQFAASNQVWAITGTLSYSGTSSVQGYMGIGGGGIAPTLTLTNNTTLDWLALNNLAETAAGGTLTCDNCFDLGNNTNITINPPVVGGGGGAPPFIGGGG